MKNKYIENIRCLLILIYQIIIKISFLIKLVQYIWKFPKVAGQLWIPSSELWVYTLILYILPGLLLVLAAAADDGGVGAHGSLVVGLAVGEADQDVYNPGVGQRAKTGQATVQE